MLVLEDRDISMLRGDEGHSRQLAMEIIVELGKALDAPCLVDIASVHIDGCVYAGRAGLEFTELLSQGGLRLKFRPPSMSASWIYYVRAYGRVPLILPTQRAD